MQIRLFCVCFVSLFVVVVVVVRLLQPIFFIPVFIERKKKKKALMLRSLNDLAVWAVGVLLVFQRIAAVIDEASG